MQIEVHLSLAFCSRHALTPRPLIQLLPVLYCNIESLLRTLSALFASCSSYTS